MIGHFLATLSVLAAQPVTPPAATVELSVPASMPADIIAAFAATESALATLSGCVGNDSVMTPQRLATFDRRLMALRGQANGVWGPEALATLPVASTTIDCERGGGATALATAAELQLTELTAKLSGSLAPMRAGVWFGTMPLCGEGPVRSDLMVDLYTADNSLVITLTPAKAAELAQLTTDSVGHALAFRALGRVVSEPHILEPIVGGQLQINGPARSELQQVQAALKSCPKITP